MEKTNAEPQVSASGIEQGEGEKSTLSNISTGPYGCSRATASSAEVAASLPICFLVREQAKSLVTIQDLQRRMENMEVLQGEVMSAVSEIHDYLGQDFRDVNHSMISPEAQIRHVSPFHGSKINTFKSKQTSTSFVAVKAVQGAASKDGSCRTMPLRSKQESATWKQQDFSNSKDSTHKIFDLTKVKDSSALESDKQDSGLESDCRDHGQETSLPQGQRLPLKNPLGVRKGSESDDELLELLNEIGHKGEALQQHIALMQETSVSSADLNLEVSKLQKERSGLCRLLSDIKGERDDLQSKLSHLENASHELASEKQNLEEQLLSALVEKQHLEHKIRSLHKKFLDESKFSSGSASKCGMGVVPNSESHNSQGGKFMPKVDGAKVSSILTETSVLELQRQVLLGLMENEILQTKLTQTEQQLFVKSKEWLDTETVLKTEIRQLMQENQDVHIYLEEQKIEISALKSKVRMLEKVLEAVTLENRELNLQLGESLGLGEVLQSARQPLARLFSNTTSSQSEAAKQRRSSLPSKLASQQTNSPCSKPRWLSSTTSFFSDVVDEPDHQLVDRPLSSSKQNSIGMYGKQQKSSLSLSTPLLSAPNKVEPYDNIATSPADEHFRSRSSLASGGHKDQFRNLLKLNVSSETSCTPESEMVWKGKDAKLLSNSDVHRRSRSSFKFICSRSPSEGVGKPLVSIDEKPNMTADLKKFPLNSMLVKLKSVSDSKLGKPDFQLGHSAPTNLTSVPSEIQNTMHSSNSKMKTLESKYRSKSQCTARSATENDQQLIEECRKMCPGGNRSIHKRMQDFLDRITAESDEAMV